MVPYLTVREYRVRPRLRAFGIFKPWSCETPRAERAPLDHARREEARSLPIASPRQDRAQRTDLEPIQCGAARRYALYTFDFIDPEAKEARQTGGESAEGEPGEPIDRRLAWILSSIFQPPLDVLMRDGPLTWPHPLLEHQQVGVAALIHNRQLLLADDMGLGKTIQVLAALRILAYSQVLEEALVVAPASLLRQWEKEAALWAPDLVVVRVSGPASRRAGLWRLPAHIKLVAYETLREDASSRSVAGRRWGVVVLDEASRIKNPESQISAAVRRLNGGRRWALTGTPIENRAEDLDAILSFLLKGQGGGREELGRLQLRRKKSDVLTDLPEKTVVTMPLEMGGEQTRAYESAARDGVYRLRKLGADLKITHVLELLIRLKQLCNVDPVSGRSAKLDDIEGRIQTLVEQGYRALIFSQFTDATFGVDMVARRLAHFRPLTYTGGMSDALRAETLDRFANRPEHKVLAISLKAGGVGLNLQSASYVFHLDRWWNPAIEDQAEARSHRMGQRLPVTVYRYVCENTIEDRIERLLAEKRDLFLCLIDGVSNEPLYSQTELLNLLDLGDL